VGWLEMPRCASSRPRMPGAAVLHVEAIRESALMNGCFPLAGPLRRDLASATFPLCDVLAEDLHQTKGRASRLEVFSARETLKKVKPALDEKSGEGGRGLFALSED